MITYRLLEAFSDRRLGLMEGDGRAMVLTTSSALGAPGSSVHRPTLAARLDQFSNDVDLVVFLDGSFPDAPTIARTDDMLSVFADEDALCDWRPVTEAVKQVQFGRVAGAVDRETLVRPHTPYVLRRPLVERIAEGAHQWLDPMEEAAALGANIRLWHDPRLVTRP
ncbi:MAG: hypothetical protein GEU79_00670 [Acidimicrobiia bacterium]|nr:hypothetical protein [Acidimicrobiia bacterium]